ncbi:DNA N-6-adenine-methyltransferase [Acidithiobacillus sulfuriphilus]|nr:DNA N-6-adenine-methyltransferase [Acidithiobacillus sulfuriphilus]
MDQFLARLDALPIPVRAKRRLKEGQGRMDILWQAIAESPWDMIPKPERLIARAGGIRSAARLSGLSKDTVRQISVGRGTLKSYLSLALALGLRPRLVKKARWSACLSSERDDWTTPPQLLEKILDALGRDVFDLDPCSPGHGGPVPAYSYYTPRENGLEQSWNGLVFVNPPYSQVKKKWASKIVKEAAQGAQIIALILSRTGAQWWHQAVDTGAMVLYLRGRLKFGEGMGPAPFDSALWLFNFPVSLARELAKKVGGRLDAGSGSKMIPREKEEKFADDAPICHLPIG